MSSEDAVDPSIEADIESGTSRTLSRSGGGLDAKWIERVSDPSDAFQALGNEIRTEILETMRERTDGDGSSRATFSELFEASNVDTSAGFAYHLEQLVGPFLRKHGEDDEHNEGDANEPSEGYELTDAGLRIARAISTGAYTHRVDHPPVPLEEACPFCDREALSTQTTDNVVTVACTGCDRTLLRLGFPPSGLEAHGENFPNAFDRHHRHRLARMRDGVCPDCAGDVTARLVFPDENVVDELPDAHADHVQAEFECECCGTATRAPVSLTLLEHPAVVSFYHDHGRDVRERPLWNVGREWAETVLSEEPLAVRVVVELEDEALALYVDAALRVVDVQRTDETARRGDYGETETGERSAGSTESASASGEA